MSKHVPRRIAPHWHAFPSLLWVGLRQNVSVKRLFRFTVSLLLFGLGILPGRAEFSSLYAFGDGVCTTTNNGTPYPNSTNYYGRRYSNGRVWIEVLAERLGLTYESNKNWSYYGHYSRNLLTNVNNFAAPGDASNSLFIVWVNDADFVDFMGTIFPSTNIVTWTNAMNQSLSNHFRAITNLYHAKGARTLVMPNAVDIGKIPQYNLIASTNTKSFIRQRIIDYNAAFAGTLMNQVKSNCAGITIFVPDVFTLFDNLQAHAADYGLTNALYMGQPIDALEDPLLSNRSTNGPGVNYIFWDPQDPTAKAHAVMADVVQQLISPVRITGITASNGSNRLDMANVPIGLNGFVNGSTNLANWATVTNFSSISATQSVLVPISGPMQFYRLRFPYAWSWP
jgi:phospholipase/lecithinase/hemolysin